MVPESLEQKRAQEAWNDVRSLRGLPQRVRKDYRSLARDFPSMVQSMGIGQAMAFLLANAGKEDKPQHRQLSNHIAKWLLGSGRTAIAWTADGPGVLNGPALLDKLLESGSEVWWHCDREAIAFGWWLKRFAEADIQADEADRQGHSTPPAGPGQPAST